ncbi:MAG: hypothetical protein PHN92_06530 [Geobacter sp.]|nr:hypothetical protein [Geobacter sp.]
MSKSPSDFNDLAALLGLDAVRQQIVKALERPVSVAPCLSLFDYNQEVPNGESAL